MSDRQIITCPNCAGYGWLQVGNNAGYECPMCDGRGQMVIDEAATLELPKKRMPRAYKRAE